VVLGRTSVLCYTDWSLCNWKLVLPSSWCWNIQEVGASIQLVLEHSGSWCFHSVVLVLEKNQRVGALKQVEACKTEVVASH
jgi:hypothetical protein